MHEVTVFKNPEFGSVRTLVIEGEPWFVGKDVAEQLGYSNSSKAVIHHVDKEDKCFELMPVSDSQNGNLVKTAIINESGLYSLILSSKLPSAKAFKRWITSEVLPSIRKTGAYGKEDSETDVETIIRCAEIMCSCRPENKPEVMQILKNILPGIDRLEELREPEEPRVTIPIMDEDGFITDSIGRRQPPRGGCQEPFDSRKLYKLCVQKGLSDGTVASAVGCSTGQVYKWRNGKAKPTAFFRTRLCGFLGVPNSFFTPDPRGGKRC